MVYNRYLFSSIKETNWLINKRMCVHIETVSYISFKLFCSGDKRLLSEFFTK